MLHNKRVVTYLLAALMVVALSSRVWLTHDRGYYESYLRTAHPSAEAGAWVACNCPICHAEEVVAIEAEDFVYQPVVSVVEFEQAILPTASAKDIQVNLFSLRGPPYLS